MKRLKITRYLQDPCCCAVASCASAANYYNQNINYESTKELSKKISKAVFDEGLESSEMCLLLNKLGFNKVTLVTSIMGIVDYEWNNYGRKKIISVMEKSIAVKKTYEDKVSTRLYLKWLKDNRYDNNIIISYDFGKYIRKHLKNGNPVVLSFNWTMFQRFAKAGAKNGEIDPFNGVSEDHAVVANGYDDKGVWIVDSHHQCYKYKRKKYRRGFYKISWENLMTCMGQGDVFLPEEYYLSNR